MKNRKPICIIVLLSMFANLLFAQTADEALMYSKQDFNSTARAASMGGAFGALGANFTSISINPAGLGVYRSSELTFTTNLSLNKSIGKNLDANTSLSDDKYTFSFTNLGFVSVYQPRVKNKAWQNFNFSLGYNELSRYNRSGLSNSPNASSSQLDVFVQNADRYHPTQLGDKEFVAFETYLIDTISGEHYLYEPITGSTLDQEYQIDEKGYARELLMSFAANYEHKFYIGALLGIQTIRYRRNEVFTESTQTTSSVDFNSYSAGEYLRTSGMGVNFKLGIIYKPSQTVRLGVAIHTPTFFSFSEEYSYSIISRFNSVDEDGYSNYYAEITRPYSYKFRTPLRTILSGALVLVPQKMLLSVDYERTNYAKAKFYNGEGNENFYGSPDNPDTNDIIESAFDNSHHLRVGTEFKPNSMLSLRAGYAHVGNSYRDHQFDDSYAIYSGGLGFKHKNLSFDFAYSYSSKSDQYYTYSTNNIASSLIDETEKNHRAMFTLGIRF